MSNSKFLFIYRTPPVAGGPPPSPEDLQQMMAGWNAWKERFKANVLDVGDGLKPGGKLLRASGVTDGPFAESKEVVGGFSIIAAPDYDVAVAVAKACPIMNMPGAQVEIREMMGF